MPPVTPMATIAPASPIGMTAAMINGSRNDSNCAGEDHVDQQHREQHRHARGRGSCVASPCARPPR